MRGGGVYRLESTQTLCFAIWLAPVHCMGSRYMILVAMASWGGVWSSQRTVIVVIIYVSEEGHVGRGGRGACPGVHTDALLSLLISTHPSDGPIVFDCSQSGGGRLMSGLPGVCVLDMHVG